MRYTANVFLLLVFIMAGANSYAKLSGQAKLDSLLKELPKAKDDTNKCKILNDISFGYRLIDVDKGISYGRQDSMLAEKLKLKIRVADADNSIGLNFQNKGNFSLSIAYFNQALRIQEEIGNKKAVAVVLGNIGCSYGYMGEYGKALDYHIRSLNAAREVGAKKSEAIETGNIAFVYANEGNYPKAIEYFLAELKIQEDMNEKDLSATLFNLGLTYQANDNFPKAFEYFSRSLQIAEGTGNRQVMRGDLTGISEFYNHEKNYPKQLEYNIKSLEVAKQQGDNVGIAMSYGNIGISYGNLKNYTAAVANELKGIELARSAGAKNTLAGMLVELGTTYIAMVKDTARIPVSPELQKREYIPNVNIPKGKVARLKLAINYLHEALDTATAIKAEHTIWDCYKNLAEAYKLSGDYKTALMYTDSATIYKDSLFNSDNNKKIANIETRRKEQLDSAKTAAFQREVAIKEQHHRNYMYMAGGVIVLLLGFTTLLTRNNKLLSKERKKSDDLLLNILPEEVAGQLKEHGNAAARHYDNVTVLFTDFVNFTSTSERMTPHALVEELHTCFQKFDEIMERHNLEKIKTIGDAYLAAAGLPTADKDHATHAVQAAIEIRTYMEDRYAKLGDSTFQVRIGIHSGSVVAGIVGSKKFAYDIWGDTVNTAARMEQHSEPGRINISEVTYQLVHNKFSCEYRGEIAAKGKGMMRMYYI